MSSQHSGSAAPTPASIAPENCSVLVVDDDVQLVESLGRALSRAGYPVTTCTSPVAAVHTAPVEGLTVLVTDLDMPGMDGIELSRQMLSNDPDLAVILLTGAATTESSRGLARTGFDRVFAETARNRCAG
jgi:CheY-like chemotaxis protein